MADASGTIPRNAPSRPSRDTQVEVALVSNPGDGTAPGSDLFRSPAFFRLHAPSFPRAWYAALTDASTGSTLGGGWFAETAPGEARSGARGPYGGLFVPHAPLPMSLADRIVAATEAALRERGIMRVRLTLPPAAHEPMGHADWMNVYLRHSYRVAPPDLNFHVEVPGVVLADRMNSGNRAVVRTAARKGLVGRELQPSEWADGYAVNVQNRLRRGRRMTMTLDALLEMDTALPGVLHWFGVFSADRLVAASVCMRLSPHALYVFYLGEADGAERQSPVTLLVAHIHEWCKEHQVALLDLGIATEEGVPNEGLMAYKRNLGFDVSPKYSLEKDLAS